MSTVVLMVYEDATLPTYDDVYIVEIKDARPDVIQIRLNRCPVAGCRRLVPPRQKTGLYCSRAHKDRQHNQAMAEARKEKRCLT